MSLEPSKSFVEPSKRNALMLNFDFRLVRSDRKARHRGQAQYPRRGNCPVPAPGGHGAGYDRRTRLRRPEVHGPHDAQGQAAACDAGRSQPLLPPGSGRRRGPEHRQDL